MRSLLYFGEDRYLMTVVMEHFPMYKTVFIRDAHAYTIASDDWKILLPQLFAVSTRFIVMIDLVSTLIQPAALAYIIDAPAGLPCVTTSALAVGAAYLAKRDAIMQKFTAIEPLAVPDSSHNVMSLNPVDKVTVVGLKDYQGAQDPPQGSSRSTRCR
ncbi:uncharacterized protein B0H18DRAFT_1120504 [Fomitopsis serialis]|uniref:uncharacterized protein n=1 Tax=Fomitopsis serialis TaxID=139415 RepID=UPI0020076EE6|nr:uncharacterized protein B0H18DRAFT_1120504 [Neoantrodia serialis]KAH9923236.1 hypothetical protein B0H18DRAFT_1120504 [Neoantrodia serialis]